MTDNLRGIAAILASASGFVVNDAIVKLVTEELPTGEIIVVRGIMATLLIGAVAWWRGAMRPVRVLLQPPIMIRIFAAALASLFIVAALRYLPLATSTAILQVTPLAVTAGSALLLGAAVGWRRWTASLVGLAGVLLIIRPGAEGINAHVWIALAALLFTSIRDLATRFERSARRKTMGNWELYGDFYRSLCEMQPNALPHIFVETFAQNYEPAAREGESGSSQSIDAA